VVCVTLVPVSYLSAPSAVHSYRVPGKFIRRLKSLFVGWKVYSSSTNKAKIYSYSIFVQQMYWLQDKYVYMYSRKSMITVTNEVFKCFFINTKILSRSLQWFIIQYYFLFITISIFLLDKIQYHVSRFEHQIILGILANLLVLQSRPIYLQIFYLQKSPMLENSVCHCWWLWNINA
jgi:hypothetical protein